jgi:eukaryotic-like serine/threonine-protein kinase
MVGQTFGPYRIVEELGVGGMGVVYRAQDTRLHRAVALKFLPAELSRDPRAIDRLLREAQAASALNHPNICTVFDVGEGDGRHFIVMELLDGMTLEHRAAGRPQPTAQLIRWGTQLADALDAAHERGIIHRDLKPANIFVTSREDVKILDFGIAKFIDARSGAAIADSASATKTSDEKQLLTIPGSAIGTAAYMSPEQVRGEPLDRRTDLFSLGTVFYELSTGRRPFEGASPAAVFAAILHTTPVPPVQANPELPARLAAIIEKLLEKEAGLRYQHANEVRTDLERLKRDTDHTGTDSVASRTDGHARTRRRALRIGATPGGAWLRFFSSSAGTCADRARHSSARRRRQQHWRRGVR